MSNTEMTVHTTYNNGDIIAVSVEGAPLDINLREYDELAALVWRELRQHGAPPKFREAPVFRDGFLILAD